MEKKSFHNSAAMAAVRMDDTEHKNSLWDAERTLSSVEPAVLPVVAVTLTVETEEQHQVAKKRRLENFYLQSSADFQS